MAIAFSVNTQNNAEGRKTIFEEALGLNQANLASITIGFNRLYINNAYIENFNTFNQRA